MSSVPSVSVTATALGATDGSTDGGAALGPVDAGAALGADDGAADEPGVHAAMNAPRPARPVPARKPRRLTRVRDIRCRISSRFGSAMPVLLLPAVPDRSSGVASAHEDQVRPFVPADRDRLTRSQ